MCHATQRQNDGCRIECQQFLSKISIADHHFLRGRLVLGRHAANGIGYPAIDQLQAVVSRDRLVSRGESESMQGPVQQQSGVVTCKWAPGTIGAVHPRRQSDDQQSRSGCPEGWHRLRVIARVLLP